MASTLWRSCSVIKTFSRLHNCAEIRCLHRSAAIVKPILKSTSLTCQPQAKGGCALINRDIHITRIVLMKKTQDDLYEDVKVYNQEGKYLCTTEMFVVDRFCHRYRIFTFEEMKTSPDGDNSSKAVQLIPKPKPEIENSEKKIKTMKFKKDISAEEKMPKIMSILVNSGKINIHFQKEKCIVEPAVKETLSKYAILSKPKTMNPGSEILATLKSLDSVMLISLLEAMQREHADHIASVKDMLDFMKKEG